MLNVKAALDAVLTGDITPPVADFTSDVKSGTMPLTVQFTDNSSNSPTSWQWNFGDGTPNATTQNISHTFSNAGAYTVILTVSNAGGSSSKPMVNYITVLPQKPVSKFTSNATAGIAPLCVQFNDTSLNTPTVWQWNFGDGSPVSDLQNPVHTYQTQGTYNVALTTSNAAGPNLMPATGIITVSAAPTPTPTPPPVANFTTNRTSGTRPLTIQFIDTSSGGAGTSWEWNFGDGTPNATTQNALHTYSQAGTYAVTLTVANAGGSSTKQVANYIAVLPKPPEASFTANTIAGYLPLTVLFNDTSSGDPGTGWQWYFGDGAPNATTPNVSHTYSTAGTYTVTFTVSNAGGSSTKQMVNYITVLQQPPVANFTSDVRSGTMPLTVQFTDASSNSPTSWQWNFGDGSANSTLKNPAHTYNTAGIYDVALTASNTGGSSQKTMSGYIIVNAQPSIVDFTADVTTGYAPLTVQFTDRSTNSPTAWEWNFGDSSENATVKNPVHQYMAAGTYTVTLTVTNAGGVTSKTVTGYITVMEHNAPPTAAFTSNTTGGYAPLTVQFNDTSSGAGITQWQWAFSDGTISSARNATHTFAIAGTYTVTLTVTNDGGSSTTPVSYITVTNPIPSVSFTSNKTSGNAPLSIRFNDTSTGAGITSWQWDFGDTTGNSTDRNPAHTYATVGTYTVMLTVTNDGGSNTSVKTNYVTVHNETPNARFTADRTSGNAPLTIAFTDASTGNGIMAWQWNFGDGSTSTEQSPVHNYAQAGTYTVMLTVTNDGGSNTITKNNYVTVRNATPSANFTSNTTNGIANLAVGFTDTSTGNNIASWQWDFGDQTTNSTVRNPSHVYTKAGTYTVTLTVTNDGGSNTIVKTDYIMVNKAPLNANFTASKTSGYAPLSIQFTDTSTGEGVTSWQWNFGDLTSNSTVQNPSHTYTQPGTYAVTLTVTNADGTNSITKTGYITVTVYIPPTWKTYIPNTGGSTISVINQSTDTVTATITTGTGPYGIAFSPDGKLAYVAVESQSKVTVISTATDKVINNITVGKSPHGVAISPDGKRLYVANYGGKSISVINTSDTSKYTTIGTISGITSPHELWISPDGSRLYVSTYQSNSVYVINTANDANTIVSTITGSKPYFISLDPSGSRLFVANYNGNNIQVYDALSLSLLSTISTAKGPLSPIISPDGSRLYYVTDSDNKLTIAYANNYTAIKTVTCGSGVRGIACSPDGSKVYVTNMNGASTSIVNVTNDAGTVKTVRVGSSPYGLGQFAGYYPGPA
jgi:YVTN family beta-propeller protein